MMPSKIKSLLQKMALFSQLPEQEIERICHQVSVRDINRQECIVKLGDVLEGFYIILNGSVTISVISPKGDSRIIEIVQSGQSFGEALMFLQNPSPVHVQATQKGRVIFVPASSMFDLLGKSKEFNLSMLAGLSQRLHKLIMDIQNCSLNRSHQRVIGYLLGEAATHEKQGDIIELQLQVSKKLLASRLDLTAETFSRILHELSEAGMITVDGKKITVLSVEKLRGYMGVSI